MPDRLNFITQVVPNRTLTRGSTNDRYQEYGFDSYYFLVQEVLFYSVALLTALAFSIVFFVVVTKFVREERREDFKKRMKLKFKGSMLRFIM